MSIFINDVKTFKTNITGKEVELKANLAVWLFLEADYGIKQHNFQQAVLNEYYITSAKFIASIFKANGYETSVDEILNHVTETDIELFSLDYQQAVVGDMTEELLKRLGITEDSELGKSILNTQVDKLLNLPKEKKLVSKKKHHKKNHKK